MKQVYLYNLTNLQEGSPPLNAIDDSKIHPRILAVGDNEKSITQYFIVVEKHLIKVS